MEVSYPDDRPIKDYRLTVRIRNNRLLSHIERAGFMTIAEFCRRYKLSEQTVGELVGLRAPAWSDKNGWRQMALRLAGIFKVSPEELFRGRALLVQDLRVRVDREVDESEMISLSSSPELLSLPASESSPEAIAIDRDIIDKLIKVLSPRQRLVIESVMGLNGPPLTLEHISQLIDIKGASPSRERVRQIYLGALAKMRRRAYQLHLFASDRLDLLGNLLSPEDIQIAQAERQRIAEEHRQAEERNKQRQAAWDALSEEDKQARLHPPPAWKCTGCSAYNYQDLRGLEFVVCGHCGLRHRVEPR